MPAFRLLEVLPDAPAFTRRLDAPFVGRRAGARAIGAALGRAARDRAPQLCTIVGPPGIGKSRLVRELIADAERRARILVARCLPYGEGITYWPLGRDRSPDRGRRPRTAWSRSSAARSRPSSPIVVGATGLGHAGGSPEEIAWAARKLLEALARDRPLVVVVDDIHWAEPTLLDLIEYVVGFAVDVPLWRPLHGSARALRDAPAWASPRSYATLVALEPLPLEHSRALVDALDEVDERTRARGRRRRRGEPAVRRATARDACRER